MKKIEQGIYIPFGSGRTASFDGMNNFELRILGWLLVRGERDLATAAAMSCALTKESV